MEKRGKLITFEGIEGSGKSTQMRLLAAFLRDSGFAVLETKQPGGTAIGQQIRDILLSPNHKHMVPVCEALLYLADRAQHHAETIEPALSVGTWVLCDRYQDSTRAYQGAARGLDQKHLEYLFQLATEGREPDLTLLLDLDAEQGLARARHRNQREDLHATEGRFEDEALPFHRDVRDFFLARARDNRARFRVIEASGNPETVFELVRDEMIEWMAALV